MGKRETAAREGRLAIKFAGVSLIGFATDALILHIALWLGASPAWGRVLSLACAMQVTFAINGLFVFRCLTRKCLVHQWIRYMLSNGFGNFCNYFIFLTMVSTHWPVIAAPMFALAVGSAAAWAINFAASRFFVFGKAMAALEALAPGARTP